VIAPELPRRRHLLDDSLVFAKKTSKRRGNRTDLPIEQAIIKKAVALVSGPGGLASFLRREQLGARLAGPSLPLDVGYSDDVPAAIRNAVKLRDKFCQWVGGCHQPAAACEVHHLRHKGRGGETSLENCILLCFLCRYRHKKHYADLEVMPTSVKESLA
jgi:hypothetical protein